MKPAPVPGWDEGIWQEATEQPTQADLTALWRCFERVMATLDPADQLRLGGEVITQLAELHYAKAQAWLDAWEAVYDPQDPQMAEDWLRGLVRQSQHLDLSALTAAPLRRRRRVEPPGPEDSIAGEVAKETLLTWVDERTAAEEAAQAIAVAHAENIGAWVTTIRQWFDHHPQPIALGQLQQQLGWPLVKLWLSLLLGNFALEAIGDDFYNAHIWVSCHDSQEVKAFDG